MAQAADTGGGGSPYAKFRKIGDKLVGAFASAPRECKRQATQYETKALLWKDDEQKKPLLEEVMYFVVMPGTTAKKGNEDNGYEDLEEMDVACYSVGGFKWGQVIDARRNLPAHAGFKAGQPCSGDIYEIELIGWSAETKNPGAAEKAGYTVIDGRIVLRTQEDKTKYVLMKAEQGGNVNTANDFRITIRRPTSDDKAYEQRADEVFLEKPWARTLATVGAAQAEVEEEEPF